MIRPACGDDIEAITDIEQACFGATAWSRELVRGELDAEHRIALVVEVAESVIGYASVSMAGETADLLRVAVLPTHRGGGHGRALVEAGMRAAVLQGAAAMLLEVDETNEPAIALYLDLGFEVISQRRDYPRAGANSHVMQRDLTL